VPSCGVPPARDVPGVVSVGVLDRDSGVVQSAEDVETGLVSAWPPGLVIGPRWSVLSFIRGVWAALLCLTCYYWCTGGYFACLVVGRDARVSGRAKASIPARVQL
jgi:hypothetical protein